MNWEALGQKDHAQKSRRWVQGSIAFFIVVMLGGLIAPNSEALDLLSKLLGFALLVAWYYSIGKYQQFFVFAKLDGKYRRKDWLKPILAALAIMFGILLLGAVLLLLLGASGAA